MLRAVCIVAMLLIGGRCEGQERKDVGRRRAGAPARVLQRDSAPRMQLIDPDRKGIEVQKGQPAYQPLVDRLQEGLTTGAVELFTQRIAPQVYINLRGGGNGYFSGNQAHYLLMEYLRNRRLVNLRFSTVGESGGVPYATGSATLVERGTRGIVQVYVSMVRAGEEWNVTQIAIY